MGQKAWIVKESHDREVPTFAAWKDEKGIIQVEPVTSRGPSTQTGDKVLLEKHEKSGWQIIETLSPVDKGTVMPAKYWHTTPSGRIAVLVEFPGGKIKEAFAKCGDDLLHASMKAPGDMMEVIVTNERPFELEVTKVYPSPGQG